jgi:hypothetical protein
MTTLNLDETQARILRLTIGAHLHALRLELALTEEELRRSLSQELDALESILPKLSP